MKSHNDACHLHSLLLQCLLSIASLLLPFSQASASEKEYSPETARRRILAEYHTMEFAMMEKSLPLNKTSDGRLLRGAVLLKSGHIDSAIVQFERALQNNSNSPLPYLCRAFALAVKGDNSGATADCERLIQLTSHSDEAAYAHWLSGLLEMEKIKWIPPARTLTRPCRSSLASLTLTMVSAYGFTNRGRLSQR